jgi:hypothetical protein
MFNVKEVTDKCIVVQNDIVSAEAQIQAEYTELVARQKALDVKVQEEINDNNKRIEVLMLHKKALQATSPHQSWWKVWF